MKGRFPKLFSWETLKSVNNKSVMLEFLQDVRVNELKDVERLSINLQNY
jgi:hypothetical protein